MVTAQVQLVRPAKARPLVVQQLPQKVAIQQTITELQSRQLVQVLLGATIGSLGYLRALFPEECFSKSRYVGKQDDPAGYSANEDSSLSQGSEERSRGVTYTTLKKGVSAEADQLLDWLENGIFHALGKGYLKAVQLAIYLDESQPEKVVESYTFSFFYRGKDAETPYMQVQVEDSSQQITESEASKSVQQMVRRLLQITQGFSPLPDKRWLTARLHYWDHTPGDYDPPGFERLSSSSSLALHVESPEGITKLNCGHMDSGFHSVCLKVSKCDESASDRPGRRHISRVYPIDDDIELAPFGNSEAVRKQEKLSSQIGSQEDQRDTASWQNEKSDWAPESAQSVLKSKNQETSSHAPVVSNRRGANSGTTRIYQKEEMLTMLAPPQRDLSLVATQPLDYSQAVDSDAPDPAPSRKRASPTLAERGVGKRMRPMPRELGLSAKVRSPVRSHIRSAQESRVLGGSSYMEKDKRNAGPTYRTRASLRASSTMIAGSANISQAHRSLYVGTDVEQREQ